MLDTCAATRIPDPFVPLVPVPVPMSTAAIAATPDPDLESLAMEVVSSFADLTDANIAFLEGKLARSPYYCEPVYTLDHPDAKHASYAHDLIELNRLGFYTMDSQPGVGVGMGSPTQRSYMCGILHNSVADALVPYLMKHHNKGRYHCEFTHPDGTQKGCYLYDADSVFFIKINLNPSHRGEASLLPYNAKHQDLGETERYYARKRAAGQGPIFSETLEAWEKCNESAYDTYHDTCSLGIDSHGSFCMRWIHQTADEYLGFHPPHVVDLLKENYTYIVIISQLETGIAVEKLLLEFYARVRGS